MSKLKIGIDMGHCLSGADTSARGIFVESDYNRKIGNLVIQKLKEKGHTVVNCTVDGGASDMYDSLRRRVRIANDNNVDIFCSIHFNAFNGKAYGTETYLANRGAFLSEDSYKKNYAIAKNVNDKVVKSCGFYNRGVKHEDFYVVYNTKAPAILVEICFCDNEEDAKKLNIENVAIAICEGLTNEDYSTKAPAQVQTPSSDLYRVRKTWADAASQIGAYKSLDNAKKECDQRSGYSVFDGKGNKVYPIVQASKPVAPAQSEYKVKEYHENGTFVCTVDAINFRNNPLVANSNPIVGQYYYGESVNYSYVVITNCYVYISWISASTNQRRYMPIRPIVNGVYGELWGKIY